MKASWDDHRFFLAIARARSLSDAAVALSVSQPTVSRRLAAMERTLGVRLFNRTRKGYELTAGGAELFETVVRVEQDLLQADRSIQGRDQEISGPLRFTTTDTFINGYLGPSLWAFLRQHRDIGLELVCTQSVLSISRGEADVAVRFTDTPPDTLIGRRLGTVAYGIYGATGEPGDGLQTADEWIGIHNEAFNRLLYGTFLPSTRPKHRVDSMAAMHAMVRAGLGVSILPCYTADLDPGLQRLNPQPMLDAKFDIWLLSHPDVRRTRRLRLFTDFLARQIKSDADLFEGRRPRQAQQSCAAGEQTQDSEGKPMTMKRKDRIRALLKGIETGDPEAVKVVNEAKYIQHNPQTREGSEGLAALFARLAKSNPRVNIVRAFEDGEFVFGHTEYDFSTRRIGFEVFRFEDNYAVEHWDNIQPRQGPNPSGHSMVDGPTEAGDLERTEDNRALVRRFVEDVLIARQIDQLEDYVSTASFTEHNPALSDGIDALRSALEATAETGTDYAKLHRILAEGDFVLSVCEGTRGGVHTSFYDLFHLAGGKIVEHWDTTEAVPPRNEWKNDNGKF